MSLNINNQISNNRNLSFPSRPISTGSRPQTGNSLSQGVRGDGLQLSSQARDLRGGSKPFWAQFLQNQDPTGNGVAATKKFPSDGEDLGDFKPPHCPGKPGGPIATTLKFPSDGEDIGDMPGKPDFPGLPGGPGKPGGPIATTLKFPSDGEDIGDMPGKPDFPGLPGGPGKPGGPIATTLKFPSDGEDLGDLPTRPGIGDGIAATKKFPSDGEDLGDFTPKRFF